MLGKFLEAELQLLKANKTFTCAAPQPITTPSSWPQQCRSAQSAQSRRPGSKNTAAAASCGSAAMPQSWSLVLRPVA